MCFPPLTSLDSNLFTAPFDLLATELLLAITRTLPLPSFLSPALTCLSLYNLFLSSDFANHATRGSTWTLWILPVPSMRSEADRAYLVAEHWLSIESDEPREVQKTRSALSIPTDFLPRPL